MASWGRCNARRARCEQRERTMGDALALDARGITVRFGGVVALDSVDLAVAPGEVVGVIGPNGAGKTTLLDVVSGFTEPASGLVRLDGVDVTGAMPYVRAR